jgi:uncharacterized 2Fe-2S/4Fe-4S cluster protein (DUF4445 family)
VKLYKVDFEPVGRRGKCSADKSLLDCSRQLGVGIVGICGGGGTCHACKIQLLAGTVSEATSRDLEFFSPQEIENGWRLACQACPTGDCKLYVPAEAMTTPQRLQIEGLEGEVSLEPPVRAYQIQVPPSSLSDLRADAERLEKALEQQHRLNYCDIDIDVLRDLSTQLRLWDWAAQASVRNNEIVALSPWSGRQLGLAVDLGTTKIAGYLVDLSSGRTLATKGIMNPQISYGEDIISRISRIIESLAEGGRLQEMVVAALNQLIIELCTEVGAEKEEVVEALVVGNTAMHHILLRLPVAQLACSPFVPAVSKNLDIKARDLDLHIAPGAYAYLLPNIAGFVGADHVAMLLATEAWQARGVVIALDIGTNTEISLIDNGEIASVSCASGPAFEGGHIKDGMRAADGAIERLRITGEDIHYQTIGGVPPVGICGSGIIDAVAQLYRVGVLDKRGRMVEGHSRVRSSEEQREFLLVSEEEHGKHPSIVITQQDVREVQLAKAAIRAGIQILLEAKGRTEEEIEQVIIAGAFGNYIDVDGAVTIGMLPSLPLDRFHQVGNAAGMGAKLSLISCSKRVEAQTIASMAHYIELANAPNFISTFAQASHLGLYRLRNGNRAEIS